MRISPALRRTLLVCIALAASGCQALTRFQDCQADSDCAAGQLCNLQQHFCQTDIAPMCTATMDIDPNGQMVSDQTGGPCQVMNWMPNTGMGCRDGTRVCTAGLGWLCVAREGSGAEVCGNGIDDDCNGVIDDGAMCVQNYGPTTNMHIGSNDPDFGEGDDAPDHTVCLGAFQIDKWEVSTRAFLSYLNEMQVLGSVTTGPATMMNPTISSTTFVFVDGSPVVRTPPMPMGLDARLGVFYSPSRGWIPYSADVMDMPMVNVTWYGADRYCRWAGKHLPTEAEWWRAAFGPTGQTPYPWGATQPNCMLANIGLGGDASVFGQSGSGACVGVPLPADSVPAGANPEGVLNLYGNVNEWMYDWLNDSVTHTMNNYYQATPDGGWCAAYPLGPVGPDAGAPIQLTGDTGLYCVDCKFARGRNFGTTDPRAGIRTWIDPDNAQPFTGFRCSAGGAPR